MSALMPWKRKYTGRSAEYALTPSQVDNLLRRIDHLEDEALIRTAIATGIRREDVVAVRVRDIDLDDGWLTFFETKKDRTRSIPIHGDVLITLRKYVRHLPKGTPWLFPSPRDPKRHLSGRAAYDILNRWLTKAGIAERPFHALRSTCIKLAQARGWPIENVMELVGDTFRTIKEHYDTPSREEMAQIAREKPLT